MINGMKIFMVGAWNMSIFVRLWLLLLMTINGVLPLFFIHELAAQISILVVMGGGMIGFIMSDISGFNRYLGLMHGPWLALAYINGYLLITREHLESDFKLWLTASLIVTCLSLVIDIYDLSRYKRDLAEQS